MPTPHLSQERALSSHDVALRVADLGPWFHNMVLAGVETAPGHPLGDYPAIKWRRFSAALADHVPGRTVLDIGCNAGFYSIEMKRLGAAHVLGIDSDERYLAQARLAADVAGVDIELRSMSVYDVAQLRQRFDIVLFMGVLYHLRHPLLALDLLHEHVVGDILVFQTMLRGSRATADLEPDYPFSNEAVFEADTFPRLHFIEHDYAGDPTNWWVPNRAGAEAMLRSAGFAIDQHPEDEVWICRRTEARSHMDVAVARPIPTKDGNI